MGKILINPNRLADILERTNITNDPNIVEQVRRLRFGGSEQVAYEVFEYVAIAHQAAKRKA